MTGIKWFVWQGVPVNLCTKENMKFIEFDNVLLPLVCKSLVKRLNTKKKSFNPGWIFHKIRDLNEPNVSASFTFEGTPSLLKICTPSKPIDILP